ncbi:MAG: nicotinate (nicotinamide) nucleotide adenylyltransferase [Treponema sp.]|jgi:nicotinate-nucleotide adenylyltransferase|nr:nicotinate (nicotinamide) nucleotide adenylyltransferase [Treponema sp.]
MRVAILGGSFNPVHIGHLALADAVISTLEYDRVIFVPAFISPFKPDADAENPQDRLDMLVSSIAGDPRLTVDDCELRRKGVSYTISTVADIIRRYCPDGKPGLVIGDDLARDFTQWYKSDEILEKADIIIARRIYRERMDAPVFLFPHAALDNEIMDISSSNMRERIAQDKNWRYLTPAGARTIIEDRRLYKPLSGGLEELEAMKKNASTRSFAPTVAPFSQIVYMENEVRRLVSPSRFLHSRNTALLCYDLCVRYGLDPLKGYLAGVVHDICKSFPKEELFRLARKDGEEMTKMERKKPSLLHARAGAALLKERYSIQDEAVLEAVHCHTTGKENMGPLAKIVFMADKIEVSRPEVKPSLRELCVRPRIGLDELFAVVLEETVTFLMAKEQDISEGTFRLLDSMIRKSKR